MSKHRSSRSGVDFMKNIEENLNCKVGHIKAGRPRDKSKVGADPLKRHKINMLGFDLI